MVAIRSFWALALLCLGSTVGASASAAELFGSFSGEISSAQVLPMTPDYPHPPSYYLGAPVTGSFALQVPDSLQPEFFSDTSAFYYLDPAWFSMAYQFNGVNYAWGSSATAGPQNSSAPLFLGVPADGDPQILSFGSLFNFFLSGPVGSLYTGLDLTTLHADPTAAYSGQLSSTTGRRTCRSSSTSPMSA